jgi:hypothetical protein
MRKLYDPPLTPERTILAEKEQLLNEIRTTDKLRCTRSGEQFFLGCKCRAYQVTSDPALANHFMWDHISC